MKKYIALSLCAILFAILSANCSQDSHQPKHITEDNMIITGVSFMPDSLNFYIDYNTVSFQLGSLLYDPFCELNPDNLTGLFRMGFDHNFDMTWGARGGTLLGNTLAAGKALPPEPVNVYYDVSPEPRD